MDNNYKTNTHNVYDNYILKLPTIISVIIPIYNAEKYLHSCISSVLEQKYFEHQYTNLEIVCINDGSTDGSLKILNELQQKDNRIKIISQPNAGLSVARNVGLKNATGEFIFFLDADDYIHPQCLEILYNTIIKFNVDVSVCNFKTTKEEYSNINFEIDTNKIKYNIFESDIKNVINHNIPISVWNKLYKKSLLQDIEFIPNIYFEDIFFTTVILSKTNKLAKINYPLYYYYQSSQSITRSSFNNKKIDSYITTINKLYDYFNKNKKIQRNLQVTIFPQIIRRLIKDVSKEKNLSLKNNLKNQLKTLYKDKIIGYRGLSLKYKFKLFYLLNRR